MENSTVVSGIGAVQVAVEHYSFNSYYTKDRWISIWHQADEVLSCKPKNVLEIGPGKGVFKAVLGRFGVNVKTLDLDPSLQPDYVASVTEMPFNSRSFDVVCAFQMLEHLPYEQSLLALKEMCRVSAGKVVISLPDARKLWRNILYVPKVGDLRWSIPKPVFGAHKHVFDGEHYWEVNKRGYALGRIVEDFERIARVAKTFRVFENSYHRFFILEPRT